MYFTDKINDSVNEITGVSQPMLFGAATLIANVWEAAKIAEEIDGADDAKSIDALQIRFSELGKKFNKTNSELETLPIEPALKKELTTAAAAKTEMIQFAGQLASAQRQYLSARDRSSRSLVEFDEFGSKLITALDEFAEENEAEMAKAEEDGDRLQAANADAATINNILGRLFDEDYPVVEAALKLQRITIELQDTAGEYLAERSVGNLAKVNQEFDALSLKIAPHMKTLEELAETNEDKADAAALKDMFRQWFELAKGSGKLFDIHKSMLNAKQQVDASTDRFEEQAEIAANSLTKVELAADQYSHDADIVAENNVRTASVSILALFIVTLAISVGLIFLTIKSVVHPMRQMTAAMTLLSEGDSSVEIPSLARADEIGDMAKAVQVFKENAIENEQFADRELLHQKEKERQEIERKKEEERAAEREEEHRQMKIREERAQRSRK